MIVTRDQALKDAQNGRLRRWPNAGRAQQVQARTIVATFPENEQITYFKNGDFVDLCAGPHVMRTGNIGAFKLTTVASAYYKGDEKNPQLQRIYGTAFKNKTELDAYFAMLEEAKSATTARSARRWACSRWTPNYVGPGLPLWLPKGGAILEELEKLAKETEFAAGYVRVKTPHHRQGKDVSRLPGTCPILTRTRMFPPMDPAEEGSKRIDRAEDASQYYLKAMNCPHHHRIFAAEPRSYRDMPLRLAEYGTCYRYEQSGELFGLMRVRSLNMNDAHIYCTPEQFAAEFNAVNEMYLKYFKIFGIEKYQMRFSTHDPATARAKNSSTNRSCGSKPRTWCAKC